MCSPALGSVVRGQTEVTDRGLPVKGGPERTGGHDPLSLFLPPPWALPSSS